MKKTSAIAGSLLSLSAVASDGVISVESDYPAKETADRFVSIIEEKGLKMFARVDHAAGAASVDIDLRPTELIIFGNPNVGAPLMQCNQQVAIDLPQKALIWEDAEGKVWFSYNDPTYLQERHKIEGCDEVLSKVSNVLANLGAAATKK